MKYFYLIVVMLLLVSCGSDDSVTVNPPVAVNDTVTVTENQSVNIYALENDDLKSNASINRYDDESVNGGTIYLAQNGYFVYTPETGFVGTDTFTYTICDILSTPNCSTATITITVTDEGDAIAADDTYEVVETNAVTFDVRENDALLDGAELTSIDSSQTNGTVVLNSDLTITYTANNGFSGNDTFTYSLCDNDLTPTCVTGTVKITVIDEGNPEVLDDAFNIGENSSATILNVLSNDVVIDDAEIDSIDSTSTSGIVVLNTDGTISYTPAANFTGEDSFTYTLCDDDATPTCLTATVNLNVITPIAFNVPATLTDYYQGVVFTADGDIMMSELERLTGNKHTTVLVYTDRHDYLYDADEDMSNTDNVILMYTGESRYWREYQSPLNSYTPQTFNTEHIYPQSKFEGGEGGDEKDELVKADLHHLRVADASINSQRSNHPYGEGDGSSTYNSYNSEWFPGDDWKGDVARMIMYVNMYHGEDFSKVGSLELFLKWNAEDPVSDFEKQRNNVIYGAQGNRNPFIDNPYLATLIWGGDAAENTWE
ncbi:hypothetical protein PW52_00105 [Tamlana sedimentorum]|uniref:Endonuclease I n=1 Tax=Neotamlana sedimentorum TaxID=1435349 RepID=A0A0D7WDX6_9FLAO|nr:Ig-like domain-containing protein [Tamlana sedimentorum]KJD36903.1 hypothetical protein PW52_00105 [Tamlana sedimentorum]